MAINAILNVNKAPGWTSFDVVRFLRGRSGERRVGHAGTLDPAAQGVLPIMLGQATRLTEYLFDATKTYRATIELGVETETYDREGDVVLEKDASRIDRDAIERTLQHFSGEIQQVPPMYSAIKREGVPMYKAARRGEKLELEARTVRVHQLDIIEYQPPFLVLDIICGKGFYVRSLAHDLGEALDVGGTLAGLVRTRVGSFRIEDAVDMDTLRAELESGAWLDRLYAPDEVLLGWQATIVGDENETRLRHGQAALIGTDSTAKASPTLCRAYNGGGEFLAILRHAGEASWRPEKVFVKD
jgi:tRNA pseudouridine55 synthase